MQFISRLLTIGVLSGAVLVADAQKSTIKVEVKNQFDKPVENASIILDFLGSHQITKLGKRKATHWEVHTNQQGIATFPPVPYGTVQVQVITKKYQTFGDKFEVDSEEKKLDIKLNPPQGQYSAHPPLKPADPDKRP
ncbi:MAG: hypothetical protein ACJ746_01135 [Bryobacteraceae bacterium]